MKRSLLAAAWVMLAACSLAQAEPSPASADDAIEPKDQVITLFNGRDLTGLYTWIVDTKYEDHERYSPFTMDCCTSRAMDIGYVTTRETYKILTAYRRFQMGPAHLGQSQRSQQGLGHPAALHRTRR